MHTLHTWAVLAAAVGALSGCAVGPQYATPTTAPIALASAQTGAFSTTSVVHGQQPWWSFFDEERLTQRIALALAHNHDIRQAQANLLAARAVFDASALDRWPAVTAQAGYQRGTRGLHLCCLRLGRCGKASSLRHSILSSFQSR